MMNALPDTTKNHPIEPTMYPDKPPTQPQQPLPPQNSIDIESPPGSQFSFPPPSSLAQGMGSSGLIDANSAAPYLQATSPALAYGAGFRSGSPLVNAEMAEGAAANAMGPASYYSALAQMALGAAAAAKKGNDGANSNSTNCDP